MPKQTLQISSPIAFLEEKMILDELVLDFFGHAGQGIVLAGVFTGETGQGGLDVFLHVFVLLNIQNQRMQAVPVYHTDF